MSAAHPLDAAIDATFEGLDWDPVRPADDLWAFTLGGLDTAYDVYVHVQRELSIVAVVFTMPLRVLPADLDRAAGFLHRLNWRIPVGALQLDMDDGEVRWRHAIDVEGGALEQEMLRNMFGAGVGACNRAFGGLLNVLYRGADPGEVAAAME